MPSVMNWSRNLPALLAITFAAIMFNSLLITGVAGLNVYAAIVTLACSLLALTLRQTKLLFLSVLLLWSGLAAPFLIGLSAQPEISAVVYKVAITIAIAVVPLFGDGPFRRFQTLIFFVGLAVLSLLGFSAFGLSELQLANWGVKTPMSIGVPLVSEFDILLLSALSVLTLIHFLIGRSLDLTYLVSVGFALILVGSNDTTLRLWLLILVQGAFVIILCLAMSQRVWRDSLTGLPGRQRLDSDLKRMPVGSLAAFVDIDHFKKFNDKYGHANGDLVLQAVAKELAHCRFAQAYRYGGEEFVLLAKPMEVERFSEQLNSLRERIAAKKFQLSVSVAAKPAAKKIGKKNATVTAAKKANKAKDVSVHISAGVGKLLLSMSHQDWLKQADDALYQAKATGRNCVVVTKTLNERRAKRR